LKDGLFHDFYVDVILPLPLPGVFTYALTEDQKIKAEKGSRVLVPFGKKKIYTGVLFGFHDHKPNTQYVKHIIDVLDDDKPSFTTLQLDLLQWISDYYVSTFGEALAAAMPRGMKLSSESYIQLNPEYNFSDYPLLPVNEKYLIDQLSEHDQVSYTQITNSSKALIPIIKRLHQDRKILTFENVKERYTPKTEKRVRLAKEYTDDKNLKALLDKLEKRPKQLEVIMAYLREVNVLNNKQSNDEGLSKSSMGKNISTSSLDTLIKNQILEAFTVNISRINPTQSKDQVIKLNKTQERVKNEISSLFKDKNVVLLHGVTGSGKTNIYIEFIRNTLNENKQVLYLVPEIVLTAQLISRLGNIFGEKLGIYHSRYSDNERVEIWKQLVDGKIDIVLGVRSSVLLPFQKLGLVIVDEEHETSFKQFESQPKYHARDVAIKLAQIHRAKVILGTATPSLETYHHAKNRKYGLVGLFDRYDNAQMPGIALIDLLRARKLKKIKGSFSNELLEAIEENLEKKRQVIIFQNRRGYSPQIMCEDCGFIHYCPNCSVSLTYHLKINLLKCHYCGHRQSIPDSCPECGSTKLKSMGTGTEKLEEELKLIFPGAILQRMDLDTTRRKFAFQEIIEKFEQGEIDILVGTQIVTKGLDFEGVNLVGVMDVDRMLHFPDFRSNERTFQLVTQVAGRAGRRKEQGTVMVQTNTPKENIFRQIKHHDYLRFYQQELMEREQFLYPPYRRLIKIELKHKDSKLVKEAAQFYRASITRGIGTKKIYGPVESLIFKVRNQFIMEIMLKIEPNLKYLKKTKEVLVATKVDFQKNKDYRLVSITIDVDPY